MGLGKGNSFELQLYGFATFQAINLLRNITDLVVPKDTYWWFRNAAPPEMYKPPPNSGTSTYIECCRSSEPSIISNGEGTRRKEITGQTKHVPLNKWKVDGETAMRWFFKPPT